MLVKKLIQVLLSQLTLKSGFWLLEYPSHQKQRHQTHDFTAVKVTFSTHNKCVMDFTGKCSRINLWLKIAKQWRRM